MLYLVKSQDSPPAARAKPLPVRPAGRPSLALPEGGALPEFERLNSLYNAIYEGPMELPPWRTALEALRDALQAMHVTLILRPPSPESAGVIINTNTVALEATQSYQTHFFALDPFVNLPEGQVVTPEELVGTRWARGALYHEFLRPLGIKHLIGADIHTADGTECRFRVSRAEGAPAFSDADKALCRYLLPHLKRSLQLHTQLDGLECERQFFAGAVNRMKLGMISFARSGAVIEINPEARRILAQKDGLWLNGDLLCTENKQECRELRNMLRDTLSGEGSEQDSALAHAMSVSRLSGSSKLGIVVRAVPSGPWTENHRRPAAVVFMRDPQSNSAQASQEMVRRLFGFTQREAALALCLAEGMTLEEAADKLNVTKNTVRTYLRFIFCKTGVTRQTALMRTLLNSVVSLC